MSKNLNEALRLLPHLTQKDLATVRSAIDHLMARKTEDDPTTALFTAVVAVLGIQASFHYFKQTRGYVAWRRTAPAYLAFVDQNWPDASKVAKGAITAIMMDFLVDDLKGQQIPVTLATMAAGLERIPQLFDAAWPGYRRAGAAHLILNAISKGKE